ncbi:MAG TPA: MarR family transcriptional regulator [Chloroflexota bacterium]
MPGAYSDRQHDVNLTVRPARSPAGESFTHLVLEVAWLGGLFTAAGESLARLADQTLARWIVLDAVADQPATVAQVARRRGIARQAVQRVADLLVRDGLAVYLPNPADRRAQLLQPTSRGRDVLHTISVAQKAWADALGAEIGEAKLNQLAADIAWVRQAVGARPLPGPGRRRRSGTAA